MRQDAGRNRLYPAAFVTQLGRTMLTADAVIAATAAAVGATLVTDNIKDFPMPEIKTMRLFV